MSTPLIKGLKSSYNNPEITVLVADDSCRNVFKFNNNIKSVNILNEINNIKDIEFDILINLHPSFVNSNNFTINAKTLLGFNFLEDSKTFYDMIYGDRKTNKNIFQIYFNLSGLTWKGESYDFYYNPKSKSNKNKTGIAISNNNLRHYVIKNLELESSRVWHIPYKQNIFKKLDETNRCQQIITDDLFIMNIAVYLRKNVYFLKTIPYNFKLEFFGKGFVFPVPINII